MLLKHEHQRVLQLFFSGIHSALQQGIILYEYVSGEENITSIILFFNSRLKQDTLGNLQE